MKDEIEITSKAAIGDSGRSVRRTLRMGSWKFQLKCWIMKSKEGGYLVPVSSRGAVGLRTSGTHSSHPTQKSPSYLQHWPWKVKDLCFPTMYSFNCCRHRLLWTECAAPIPNLHVVLLSIIVGKAGWFWLFTIFSEIKSLRRKLHVILLSFTTKVSLAVPRLFNSSDRTYR